MQQVFNQILQVIHVKVCVVSWCVRPWRLIAGGRGPGGQYYWGQGNEVVTSCHGLGEEGALSSPSPWPPGGGRVVGLSMVGADRRVKIRLCPSSRISVG